MTSVRIFELASLAPFDPRCAVDPTQRMAPGLAGPSPEARDVAWRAAGGPPKAEPAADARPSAPRAAPT